MFEIIGVLVPVVPGGIFVVALSLITFVVDLDQGLFVVFLDDLPGIQPMLTVFVLETIVSVMPWRDSRNH